MMAEVFVVKLKVMMSLELIGDKWTLGSGNGLVPSLLEPVLTYIPLSEPLKGMVLSWESHQQDNAMEDLLLSVLMASIVQSAIMSSHLH